LAPIWVWARSEGLSPLRWFHFILTAARGDKVSASPMLSGAWHLFDEPLIPLLSGFLAIFLTLLVFGAAAITFFCNRSHSVASENTDAVSAFRLASITVLINYGATFLTIARFWDYEIFVVPLVFAVLIPLSAGVLRHARPRVIRRGVLASWVVLALFLVPVRVGKVATWLASYGARDPQPLAKFIAENVPRNSYVFGPESIYFYAVENAGSHYLFIRPIIPGGLISRLDPRPDWLEQVKTGRPVYLIWPKGSSIPSSQFTAPLHMEASISFEPGKPAPWWNRSGWAYGYPATSLYRVVDPQSAQAPMR
jgi:hypothetical protein